MRLSRVGIAVLLGTLLACSGPAEPTVQAGATVELDAFSGLPNPIWTLTAAEANELQRRLEGMPGAEGQSLPEGGLGYRGFRITNPQGEGGIPEHLRVSRGLVRVEYRDGTSRLLRDVDRIEEWLIEQARRRGYGGVF